MFEIKLNFKIGKDVRHDGQTQVTALALNVCLSNISETIKWKKSKFGGDIPSGMSFDTNSLTIYM